MSYVLFRCLYVFRSVRYNALNQSAHNVFGGTALGRFRRKTVTAADEDPQLLRAMQAEKAKQDIEKLTTELRDPHFELYQRSIKLGPLADAYRILGEREKSNELLLSQTAYIKANSKPFQQWKSTGRTARIPKVLSRPEARQKRGISLDRPFPGARLCGIFDR